MNLETIMKFAPLVDAIITAANNAAGIAGTAKDAKESVTDAVKEFAKVSHDEGLPVDAGRRLMASQFMLAEKVAGSVKAYGNHFAGFRLILQDIDNGDADKAWSEVTQKDAQNRTASSDVKLLNAARQAIAQLVKENSEGATKAEKAANLIAFARSIGADMTKVDALQLAAAATESEAPAVEAERAAA